MKKLNLNITMILSVVFAFALGVLLSWVLLHNEKTVPVKNTLNSITGMTANTSLLSDSELLSIAYNTLDAIYKDDYTTLSEFVHPENGVLFVPYSTVDKDKNLMFRASDVKNFASNKEKYTWGIYSGSGKAIELTPSQYIDEFITSADYPNASVIGRNRIVGSGNSLENVTDVFKKCKFIEFYIPCINSKYGGLDWKSLKLVYEEYEGKLKLVAIIHGEWTI